MDSSVTLVKRSATEISIGLWAKPLQDYMPSDPKRGDQISRQESEAVNPPTALQLIVGCVNQLIQSSNGSVQTPLVAEK